MENRKQEIDLFALIPNELYSEIFKDLPVKDLLSLRQVAKQYKEAIDGLIFKPDMVIKIIAELNEQGKIKSIYKFLEYYQKSSNYLTIQKKIEENEPMNAYQLIISNWLAEDINELNMEQLGKAIKDVITKEKNNRNLETYLQTAFQLMEHIKNRPEKGTNEDEKWQVELSKMLSGEKPLFVNLRKSDVSQFKTASFEAWNRPYFKFNLSGAELSDANLDEIHFPFDFTNSNLIRTSMKNASLFISNLTNAVFSYAVLNGFNIDRRTQVVGTNFHGAKLEGADFGENRLNNCDFSGAELKNSKFRQVVGENIDFSIAELANVNFYNARLKNVNFNYAKMNQANLEDVKVKSSKFTGVNLDEANLKLSHFEQCNFEKVDLSKVQNWEKTSFVDSNLKYVGLNNVNLDSANFKGVDLSYANLKGTNLSSVKFDKVNLAYFVISKETIFPKEISESISFFNSTNIAEVKSQIVYLLDQINKHPQEHELRAAIASNVISVANSLKDLNQGKELLMASEEHFTHRGTVSKYASKVFTSHIPDSLKIIKDGEKAIEEKLNKSLHKHK